MTCKTVLVHRNDLRRIERSVGAAAELAERLRAHLMGLSAAPPVQVVPTGTLAMEGRADLLVMGCYGHLRMSELVLGGATRHILRHMTIPVLMSR